MNKKVAPAWIICAILAASGHAAVEPWFGQEVSLRSKFREAIREAEDEVALASDRFTDYALAEVLIEAAKRGRRVRVIVDGDKRNVLKGKALGDYLTAGGVEVQYDRSEANLYDRFIIIDERLVIVGSYPFVEEAPASPMTDAVAIDDPEVAAQYLAFFDFIWNLTK